MSTSTDFAERVAWRRARSASILAILFGVSQWGSFRDEPPFNRPETIHIAAWAIWGVILCLFLAFSGGLVRDPAARAQLNDETTREHRRRAMALGFWGAMGTALFVYLISYFEPIAVREGVRLVITLAIMLALLQFSALERKALKDA